MTTEQRQFTASMRFPHWLMAGMVLTMLGIGVAMVTSLVNYHRLISIHRPLGILVLIVVAIRFVNRRFSPLLFFPASMSSQVRFAASAPYFCCIRCSLSVAASRVGMSSAARYPIVLLVGASPHPLPTTHLYSSCEDEMVPAYLLAMPSSHIFERSVSTLICEVCGEAQPMAPWRVRAN